MKAKYWFAAVILCAAAPALAGPPYETDDPDPTELGHWEIYAYDDFAGRGRDIEGSIGLDLNYGALKGVQLTATIPVDYAGDGDWNAEFGDLEAGVKYRFVETQSGFSAAIFPRLILPTSTAEDADHHVRLLLPVWGQVEAGNTTVFGGGGYQVDPGPGNRDFWVMGLAVTEAINDRLSLGIEATHETPGEKHGAPSTSAGAGAVFKLHAPFALLISGGPTWSDGRTAYHGYAALGLAF